MCGNKLDLVINKNDGLHLILMYGVLYTGLAFTAIISLIAPLLQPHNIWPALLVMLLLLAGYVSLFILLLRRRQKAKIPPSGMTHKN